MMMWMMMVTRDSSVHLATIGASVTKTGVDRERSDFLLLKETLVLATRSVLVVGMILHVNGAQSLCLVDVGPLLFFVEHFPLSA